MPSPVITAESCGDASMLRVSGDVDIGNALALYTGLCAGLAAVTCPVAGVRAAVVDLTGVGFMDSAGLRELLHACSHAARTDGIRIAVIPSAAVRRVLELAGAERVVMVCRDRDEALTRIAASV